MLAQAASASDSTVDRRVDPRVTAMRNGQVLRPDRLPADILIVDLSERGARLRVRGGLLLPRNFALVDPRTWLAHSARVIWRKDAEVGVRLLKSQNLRGLVPGALEAGKAFCASANR